MRKRVTRLALVVLLLACMLAAVPMAHAQPPVAWQMGLCLDGSGSIDRNEWALMLGGLSQAIGDPNVVPQDGTVELTVVQFAGYINAPDNGYQIGDYARVEVPPTVVTAASVGPLVAAIQAIQQGRGRTPLGPGIDLLVQAMKYQPDGVTVRPNWLSAGWHAINVSTDGLPNEPGGTNASGKAAAEASVLAAVAQGLDELDAEGIGVQQSSLEWMAGQAGSPGIAVPSPGWIVYDGDPYPPRPPDPGFAGFVRDVDDFADYNRSIAEKFLILRELKLEPTEGVNGLRTSHTLTATLTRLGVPMPLETIHFEVIAGPNMGKTGHGTTDANGQCTWTYTDEFAFAGDVDTIRAWNSYQDHVVHSAPVLKEWASIPARLVLDPPAEENCLRSTHTVWATITDINGAPIGNASIHFSVILGPNWGTTGDVLTNGSGRASWTYTDNAALDGEMDILQATHTYNGTLLSEEATKTWVECSAIPGVGLGSAVGEALGLLALATVSLLVLRRRHA